MKKVGLIIIAFIAIAGWNYNKNNEVKLAELTFNNIEALASSESTGGYCNYTGGGCIIRYSDGSSTFVDRRWN